MSPTQARLVALGFRDLQGEPEAVGEARDILVPGPAGMLPVRVYHPAPGEARPLVVYFHGGGWVIGDVEIVDKPCRALANVSRCVVASVNYRLSPELKFPAPAEDCYAATNWLAEHAAEIGSDPNAVAVAGDSAGGNSRGRGGAHGPGSSRAEARLSAVGLSSNSAGARHEVGILHAKR